MRPLMVIGIILILLGVAALVFQGVTYYTTEPVAQAGPFTVDVQRPHTIILNPLVGLAAIVVGIVMIVAGSRVRAT